MLDAPCRYRAYGLVIDADMELALPVAPARGAAQITLTRGNADDLVPRPDDPDDPAVTATYDLGGGRWYVAFTHDGAHHVDFDACGQFRISADGSEVRWVDTHGERSHLLPILFAGTVLAYLLTLRGHLVLHASAVVRDRRALAFVAHAGQGKTTLAALAAAAGARVITDDVLRVDPTDPPRCRGSGGELRLRDAARSLAAAFTGPVAHRETSDQRLALATGDTEDGWVHLGAVVIPRASRDAEHLEVTRLSPGASLVRLLTIPRVHGLRGDQVLRTQMEQLGALVRGVPVYDALVPWGPPFQDGLADALLGLVDDT